MFILAHIKNQPSSISPSAAVSNGSFITFILGFIISCDLKWSTQNHLIRINQFIQ